MTCRSTIRAFAFVLGSFFLAEILANAFQKSAITTIERRFDLSSTATALMSTSYQIGNLGVSLLVSYYGAKWHRPRVLAIGGLIIVLGCLTAALPQFIGGRYTYQDTSQNLSVTDQNKVIGICDSSSNNLSATSCTTDEIEKRSAENNLFIFIVIGIILCGVGGSGTSALGITYVHDFAHPKYAAVYVGIIMTIALIGPAFGFILGAMVLKIWVDVGWVNTGNITITPYNPNWVGAWWLGYLISACAVFVTSLGFWFFPKKMNIENLKNNDDDQYKEAPLVNKTNADENKVNKKETFDSISSKKHRFFPGGFFSAVKRIISNTSFIFILLLWFCGGHVMVGMFTFLPKYMEVQYGTSASIANLLYGAVNVPALVVGTIMGTFMQRKYKLKDAATAKVIMICTGMSATFMMPLIFLGCDTIQIAGITVPYTQNMDLPETTQVSVCNVECNCKGGIYSPVCGEDHVTYMSPCHAGCKDVIYGNNSRIEGYKTCSCIPSNNGTFGGFAKPERCQKSRCTYLMKYMIFFNCLVSFIGGILTTPFYMLLMESVNGRDKSFAIGLLYFFMRILAWIPAPIYFGKVIDTTCLYWGYRPCSLSAYCKIYDNSLFRYKYILTIMFWKLLSFLASIALYKHYMREKKKQDTSEENVYPLIVSSAVVGSRLAALGKTYKEETTKAF